MGFPAAGTVDVPRLADPQLIGAVGAALTDPDGVRAELLTGLRGGGARRGHLCVNAWVFDPQLTRVLLVDHPRFSWTIPGGHLDPGEAPAAGALRELVEETGVAARAAADRPVALVATAMPTVRDQPTHMHYTLSYAFLADPTLPLHAEADQPAAWFPLSRPLPEGFFGDNWHAHAHAAALRTQH